MSKKAFTLAELMVVLTVIGVIVAILTPTIVKLKPNESKIMLKKAYYVTERVVNELINDETFYSDEDDDAPGFVNEGNVTLYGATVNGNTKFCQLFASKVNTSGTVYCDSTHSTVTSGSTNLSSGNFTTNDGITWFIPTAHNAGSGYTTLFTNPNATPAPTSSIGVTNDIVVDINGTSTYSTDVSPNCVYNASTCTNPDQFTITVQYDGKIKVTGTKEIEYLKDTALR